MSDCAIGSCIYNRIPVLSTIVPDSPLLLIAENPSWHEIQQGRNFAGPAGKVLDRVLTRAKINRAEVSVCNLICCMDTTRERKNPTAEEIDHCRSRLLTEIVTANPRVILLLGNLALAQFFPGITTISKARSKPRMWENRIVMASYHPASCLPYRSPENEEMLYEDVLLARSLCDT